MKQTYQTKLINLKSIKRPIIFSKDDIENMSFNMNINNFLDDYSKYFQIIERRLFVDIVHRNISITKLKKEYQTKYNINARQFNSIKSQIEGKITSIKELKKIELESKNIKLKQLNTNLKDTLKDKEKYLKMLSKIKNTDIRFKAIAKEYRRSKSIIHYTKRKIQAITFKINRIQEDIDNNIVRICFGSKDLFKKQYKLKENNYNNHSEWKKIWLNSRSNQFMCIGSKDESFGNQICQYDKENNLKITVPEFLESKYGKYITIDNVKFKYGQSNINKCKETYIGYTKSYNEQKYYTAITHRFYRNEFGWYLYTTVEVDQVSKTTDIRIGTIGIDFNVNFAQLAFIDRFGNPLDTLKLKYSMYNKNTNQINALMGDMVKDICELAKYYKTPIAIEDLKLEDIKKNLDKNKKYNRMVSKFPYKKFRQSLEARAFKTGVEVIAINPKYTSIIGQFKYMRRYGISSHSSASIIIGRRALNLKTEKIDKKYKDFLLRNKPSINLNKDNYKLWIEISKIIKKKYTFNKRIEMLYKNAI